ACVPLISKGKMFGAMVAASSTKDRFSSRDVDLLDSIGEQIAVGMESIILMAKSKRAEEHYKTLFENAGNPIIVLDEEGRSILMNKEFERLFGYTKEGLERIGPVYNIASEEDGGRMTKYHYARRQGGYAPHRYTTSLNTAKGEKRTVDIAVSMLPGSGNSVMSMVDVTDLIRIREDLERNVRDRTQQLYAAQQELIDKERLAVIGTLAASVSHELRNPLAVVQNTIDLLRIKEPAIATQVSDYLGRMEGEMERVSRIIDELLAYSELGTPAPRKLQAARILRDTLKTANVPKNIDLVTDFRDCPDVFVDAAQMERVTRSVILNAIQAMSDSGKLTISTRLKKAGEKIERSQASIGSKDENVGDEVMMIVEDTGVGIDPEVLPNVFTPMFSTRANGLGLGLSLSKSVVEQNHGRIWIESTKGKGTVVTIAFPTREE
ncbi:MAG: PAS domain S-box protein, partial [Methanomassiliicoccales archaeon]|nr:PAS domain S-box protein [Methanomassiliicoccales archaeon]